MMRPTRDELTCAGRHVSKLVAGSPLLGEKGERPLGNGSRPLQNHRTGAGPGTITGAPVLAGTPQGLPQGLHGVQGVLHGLQQESVTTQGCVTTTA